MSSFTNETEAQYKARIEEERKKLNQAMTDEARSPLSRDQIQRFKGLSYYPVDTRFKIHANLRKDEETSTPLPMTDGSKQDFIRYGSASFNLDDDEITLEVYRDKNLPELSDRPGRLFIPFRDNTAEAETSETGRFIAFDEPEKEDVVELDFNRAYNTYNGLNRSHRSMMAPDANTPKVNFSVGQRKFEDR
ncbi:MAG: DUF1684 domain-containing protein [Bacteroidales bacterium]|nr:DUF1684 domain-containing protein [Bacteroidales bacterium]